MFAADEGSFEVFEYLLNRAGEVDIHEKDINGNTMLLLASGSESFNEEGKLPKIELLLSKGANIKDMNKDGESMVHIAAEWSKVDVLQYLKTIKIHKYYWHERNSKGLSPILLAISGNATIEAIVLCLEH